jgi:hypothetical protein
MQYSMTVFFRMVFICVFGGMLVFAKVSCATESVRYFPLGAVSDFQQVWFAEHLRVMGEPIIKPSEDVKYFALRVLYLPTRENPIAIRYELRNGIATHRSVMLSGRGGYAPGQISKDTFSEVPAEEFERVIVALEKSDYWYLPDNDGVSGMDGSRLIIETVKDGNYRVFSRWTPEHQTKDRKLSNLVDFVIAEFTASGIWTKQ